MAGRVKPSLQIQVNMNTATTAPAKASTKAPAKEVQIMHTRKPSFDDKSLLKLSGRVSPKPDPSNTDKKASDTMDSFIEPRSPKGHLEVTLSAMQLSSDGDASPMVRLSPAVQKKITDVLPSQEPSPVNSPSPDSPFDGIEDEGEVLEPDAVALSLSLPDLAATTVPASTPSSSAVESNKV